MAHPVKQFLTSAFTVGLLAGAGGGMMAILDSPEAEQQIYPSLSTQDARKAYNDFVVMFSALGAVAGLTLKIDQGSTRKREEQGKGPAPALRVS